jgi:hypothetical protein
VDGGHRLARPSEWRDIVCTRQGRVLNMTLALSS